MDRLHLMTVFIAVAEERGFAAAARRLNMSPPAVTRAVAALEQRLGVKLLVRTTRHVRTTEAGHHYLQDARRILAEVDAADESAAGIHARPQGVLTITAPAMFGCRYVTPIVAEYLRRHDDVNVSSVFVDRVSNLVEEGLDLGIRIGDLPDSSLRAIHVGTVTLVTAATPAYLADFGIPAKPDELIHHRIIQSRAGSRFPSWRYYQNTETFSPIIKPRMITTTNDSAITAALQDFGVIRSLSYQVAPYIARGELITVLQSYQPEPMPVHIVHPQGRNMPAKVRAFIDMATQMLRADKNLN